MLQVGEIGLGGLAFEGIEFFFTCKDFPFLAFDEGDFGVKGLAL